MLRLFRFLMLAGSLLGVPAWAGVKEVHSFRVPLAAGSVVPIASFNASADVTITVTR